ncbi:hypothetical protein KQX54_015352 [Cotesia glomerata]|uniref:Uncharacterized protein n=1 Tax=Cotesia glomerata TaxID=32391 RepID=A0AAV7J8W2_COTGL|nr:hypothetical protein KQX54_015352 [Cotesia glomerata]
MKSIFSADFETLLQDGQSIIQVGGRWNNNKGQVERGFVGIISGLVINSARIFELESKQLSKVVISLRGDVHMLPPGSLQDRTSPIQRMQQTKFLIARYGLGR